MSTYREHVLEVLLEWENLGKEGLIACTRDMPLKLIRWLALMHPDNRTREELYRLSNVTVGERTVINRNLFIYDSYKPLVTIGSRVAIGGNVSLIAESGPNMSKLGELPAVAQRYVKTAPIVIEDDAWIGANVVILPGVTVGKMAIVGAGAVVTKDVPPHTVVAGVPARVIRTL